MSEPVSLGEALPLVPNRLQVRHYPQVPCKPFCVDVPDEATALFIINTLADQHNYLFEGGFIPDFSNAIVVVMLDPETGEWVDYYNEELEMEWDEYVEAHLSTPA